MSRARATLLWLIAGSLVAAPLTGGGARASSSPPEDGGGPEGLSGVLQIVPELESFSPEESEATWLALKATASPTRQLRALRRHHLDRTRCTGLVDLRALVRAGVASFRFRDKIRGRTWARPSLALVLIEALRRFQKVYPKHTLTLGDLSQPGCGQLAHGTLVKEYHGPEAIALAQRARVVRSRATIYETLRAADLPGEAWRFDSPEQPVRRETILLGKRFERDGTLTLRAAIRRHRLAPPPDDEKLDELRRQLKSLAARGQRVERRRVVTVDEAGFPQERWITHWIDRRRRRQLVAITHHKVGRRLRLGDALELRLSGWDRKKPGSFKGEIRWLRVSEPEAGGPEAQRWERWLQLYEAGHISHHSGRDVDISWVTEGDTHHFAVDLEAMDVAASWRWLEALVAAGDEVGAPVELLLVDPTIKRHLKAHLSRKDRRSDLFRHLLRRSPGHNAHHHLRVAAAPSKVERRARRRLERLIKRASKGARAD